MIKQRINFQLSEDTLKKLGESIKEIAENFTLWSKYVDLKQEASEIKSVQTEVKES